jgi:hypothetical protein
VANRPRRDDICADERAFALLHCNISAMGIIWFSAAELGMAHSGADPDGYEGGMGTTWHTKWGVRRVRKDPPTIEEALIAAESMTDDLDQRVEIAASLIGAPVEEVKALAAKQAHLSRGRSTLVTGRNRAVVVEYKRPRTIRPPGAARR